MFILEKPIDFNTNIQPVCLPNRVQDSTEFYDKEVMTASGWGRLCMNDTNCPKPDTLNMAYLVGKGEQGCNQIWKEHFMAPPNNFKYMYDKKHNFCAANQHYDGRIQSTCAGDSGG